ncbi:MAG TPA: hypothetical protein VNA24_24155 [Hyalangium sp.]|nr:hypothetical protein [Hyalangium sp.]
MSQPKYEKLQWTLEVRIRSEVKAYPITQVERVGAHSYFAVRGQLPTSMPILYVLSLGDDAKYVRVALMAQVSKLSHTAAGEVRLPQDGAFLASQVSGPIFVLAVERVLTREELASLIGGREPPPDPTTGDSTVTANDSTVR